jgi:hypothetical protein
MAVNDSDRVGPAMIILLKLRVLLLIALLLVTGGSASSQQTTIQPETRQKALSYTFVSPNTRENLTLGQALRLLNSREELRLISDIQRLSRCLGLKPLVMKTIGSWTDGAEHSTLFRTYTDQPTLRYADARLGKLKRQKIVLYFRQDDSGAARMYLLHIWLGKRSLDSVSKTLDRNGVAFRTLVPGARRRMVIYVVDLNDELRNRVVSVARNLGALLDTIKGTGEFIGDDADRDKAEQVFSGLIKKYEDENPKVARRCSQ